MHTNVPMRPANPTVTRICSGCITGAQRWWHSESLIFVEGRQEELSCYQSIWQYRRAHDILRNMSGAEVLGVIAASEQFIEVAFKLAKFVKTVVAQIQDAPDQLRQEAGRIESLASLAAQIKNTESLQTEDIKNILLRC